MKLGLTLAQKNTPMPSSDIVDVDVLKNNDYDHDNNKSNYNSNSMRFKERGSIWYIGSMLFVFGNIVNFVSFSFAAQSLLAAIGSAQFVSNVFFSKIILGETITRRTVYATCAILMGNVLVVYSFSHGSASDTDMLLSTDEVIKKFDRGYLCFLGGLIVIFCSCRYMFVRIKRKVDAGEYVQYANRILPTAYAAYSAVLGSQSVLLAKCLSILLRVAMDDAGESESSTEHHDGHDDEKAQGNNIILIDEVYVSQFILLGWLITISFWLRQMNRALAQFDGVFIIPVLQVFWTFFSIVSGGVFFKEFLTFSTSQSVGFSVGIIIVFYGVVLLSSANAVTTKSKVSPTIESTEIISAKTNVLIHPV